MIRLKNLKVSHIIIILIGIVFVLVRHLALNRKSILTDLDLRYTRM